MTGMRAYSRHLLDDLVGEGADHDPLHHALEVLGDVVDRLALAEVDLGRRQVDREPAELLDADVEVTRVRSDGFSKISASVLPLSALGVRPRGRALMSARERRAGGGPRRR